MDRVKATRHFAGDIWELYDQGLWLVDPTNATVKADGSNVMGRGISAQVAGRFPATPTSYGRWLMGSSRPQVPAGVRPTLADLGPVTFVAQRATRLMFLIVKADWHDRADPELITRGLTQLGLYLKANPAIEVVIPRLGCGAGGLDWERTVRPLFEQFLGALPRSVTSRLTLVDPPLEAAR